MSNLTKMEHEDHEHFNELAGRDPTVIVVTLQTKGGEDIHVWAEMDTGSFENLVSQELLAKLERDDEVNLREEQAIKTISEKVFTPKGDINLSFTAGKKQKAFTANFRLCILCF